MKSSLMVLLFLVLSSSLNATNSARFEEEKGIADWLFFLSPAKTTFQTQYNLNEVIEIIRYYKEAALSGELAELGVNTGFVEVENKNDRTTLILFRNSFGELSQAFKIKIKPKGEQELLEVKARAVYAHLVDLFEKEEEDLSRFEFSRKIEDLASVLLKP